MVVRWTAILLIGVPSFAQDSTYVRQYDDQIAIRVFALNTSVDYQLHYAAENLDVNIVPNHKTTINVGVQYDIISASYGFAPSFFADNKDNKGSKMMSFATDIFPGRFMQHLELHYQKGMSIENPDTGTGEYFPRFKSIMLGGQTAYLLNPNYSVRAVNLQNAKQLKSAGTLAPGISYQYTRLEAKDEPEIGGHVRIVDIAAEASYYYTWVAAKNLQFSASATLGIGGSWTKDDNVYSSVLYKAGLMLAPGYNNERFFAGAMIWANANGRDAQSSVTLSDVTGYATAFIGFRLDPPEKLRQGKDKLKSKLKK